MTIMRREKSIICKDSFGKVRVTFLIPIVNHCCKSNGQGIFIIILIR